MSYSFRDIKFPETYQYASDSDDIPLKFYEETFPISKRVDLLLGYFSSNAIRVLANTFAELIYNGGSLRIVTNHVFSLKDKENLLDYVIISNEDRVIDLFSDLDHLVKSLSDYGQHFFDCLRYLKQEGRLSIVPVKFNEVDLAHSKKMILFDGKDTISTDGSINFTLAALTKNQESFQVNVPWEGDIFNKRIEKDVENFEQIFSGKHPSYKYLDPSEVEVAIDQIGQPKEIAELLEDSIELSDSDYGKKVKHLLEQKKQRFDYFVSDLKGLPRFPFPDGPREYQKEAYEKWVENDYQGIFAMATGTGKTITSLNCLVNEYNKTKNYQAIILVPTVILLKQWKEECKNFNFNFIISSDEANWNNQLSRLILLSSNNQLVNFVFITTYATFNGKKCQSILSDKKLENVILIADESHNLGTSKTRKNLPIGVKKRIGLSATPNRKYDFEGTRIIEDFFNSKSPSYTYSYPMKKAIDEGFLCKYEYHPFFANLEWEELEAYKKISIDLLKHFDFKNWRYRESADKLLIARKRIIHQARNKKIVFRQILEEIKENFGENLKYTLVYVPEGYEHDYSGSVDYDIDLEDRRIIDKYSKIVSEGKLTTHQVLGETSDRERVLKHFEEGKIAVLTAMKTLDEGVDIPATKYAIFCSSTGNPRQFIQRRGRILRNFEGKDKAYVYDIVIKPNLNLWEDIDPKTRAQVKKMETNIFRSEIYRVANFLYAAENRFELSTGTNQNLTQLRNLAEQFDIDLDGFINELDELEKNI